MVNGSDATAPGGWEDEAFAETVSQHAGIGFDADLPDENRFTVGVVQLLMQRRAEMEAREEPAVREIAVFILQPNPRDYVSGALRVPMVDNGLTPVVGRLWFTSAPVISAYYVDLPEGTDDERITYVVEGLGLGHRPALIYDSRPSTPQLRWYPRGLGQLDEMELKPLEGDVDPEDVFDAIDKMYRECLVTPGALPPGVSLWKDARRHRPLRNAEAQLQAYLKLGLSSRFPFCRVWHEQSQPAGRSDLEIEQVNPVNRARPLRHGTIELKVLRSFRSKGSTVSDEETRGWISKGVDQAAAYRSEKGCRWAALCCFDMRTVDDSTCFHPVQTHASGLDVTTETLVPVRECSGLPTSPHLLVVIP